MANYFEVAERWAENARGAGKQPLRNPRMIDRGDRIYSYGSHFELARVLRDKRGEATAFLLNGDTYSVTTARHQREILSAVQRRPSTPYVTIPHSALTAAGIDLDTVEIVEATSDRMIPVQRQSRTEPTHAYRGEDGVLRTWQNYPNGEITEPSESDPFYRWTSQVHRLGESVIRAKVQGRRYRAYFLSGFDVQESRPLYFFCELPRGAKPATVAEAYEALKPATVKTAEAMGRPVTRQGDIFAVGMNGTTKRQLRREGARFERRGQLLGTNHVATEVARMPDGTTLARGTLWHAPPSWRRPDHKRQTMGKAWHVIVKNTVPLTR